MTDADVTRTKYPDRGAWLEGRQGIGASEIGSVLGVGFKSTLQLWEEKCGLAERQDIGGNERVRFGNDAEEPLRWMFRLMHPEYNLHFEPYTILRRKGEYEFLFYTPDGELYERATGRRGLYESKTATCLSRKDWDKWNGHVPDGYFCQICQGMFVGGYDFAEVFAMLLNQDGDAVLRAYHFERADCEESIRIMLPKAKIFWHHVETRTMPAQALSL